MPTIGLLQTLFRELTVRECAQRVPEPDLVMDDPKKVADYVSAGREAGIMSPTYIFHCSQMCEVIMPGDVVLDLACGPATQLGMLARINPDSHFIGIDLSRQMLDRAQKHIKDLGLTNVELLVGDIAALSDFADASVGALVSTMSLHHLPVLERLEATFAESRRVLKPNGGLYFADFGHLKSEKSIRYFAYQHKDTQPELFTIDYLNSLRAAFQLNDFRWLTDKYFKTYARVFSTFAFPLMVVVKSRERRTEDQETREALWKIRVDLAPPQQRDLKDLISFFKLGGLSSRLLT